MNIYTLDEAYLETLSQEDMYEDNYGHLEREADSYEDWLYEFKSKSQEKLLRSL